MYHRSGSLGKALELCFQHQLYDDLEAIADDLTTGMFSSSLPFILLKLLISTTCSYRVAIIILFENTKSLHVCFVLFVVCHCLVGSGFFSGGSSNEASDDVLQRCATFFLEHEQYPKAVNLLVSAGQYERSLELCAQHRVRITEEMADLMTLPKQPTDDSTSSEVHKQRRQRLLIAVAELCERQNAFHLATKKYTQAGDRSRAMRSLLKSGDTEKIIFFAGVSRSREIYVLAANYLQSLNWSQNPEIVKNIIQFYSKARAYDQLANFFDACASVEIDEYQNYEKAVKALKEAIKHANKIKTAEKETKVALLEAKANAVGRFVEVGQQ